MQKLDLSELSEKIFLYHIGELNEEEKIKLEALMEENEHFRNIVHQLRDTKAVEGELQKMSRFDANTAYRTAFSEINSQKRRKFYALRWLSAAAIMIFGLLILGRNILTNKSEPEVIFTNTALNEGVQLRLSDGTIVLIDTLSFFNADGAHFIANDSALEISVSENMNHSVVHELHVPYRHKQQIVLSDGSKVYLNAGSKLIFPSVFASDQRKVTIEGEGYFEIQPSSKPFIVETLDQTIKVYGTTFNVRAYPDEQIHYTELLEGSVSVRSAYAQDEHFLRPGQQMKFDRTDGATQVSSMTSNLIAGWKDGWLAFENTATSDILKQIGRWYNLNVSLDDNSILKTPITGKILLYPDVRDLLSKFEKLGDLKFSVSEDQIVVKHIPNK